MRRSGVTGTRRIERVRCAIYTRKSSEEGLEQEFNSLQAQREACEAFINSQRHEGWVCLPQAYDDGGFSGATMERPALQRLLSEVAAGRINVVVVYKVDLLTRSLADFARIVEMLDRHGASFVSVTQQFNTTTSMGRLTLNVLLSFAQFEREVTAERIAKPSAPHLFGRQERDFLPRRLRSEIGRLPLPVTGDPKDPLDKPAVSGHFLARLHMSVENVNAWWGWKDSNLQPERYERTAGGAGKRIFPA